MVALVGAIAPSPLWDTANGHLTATLRGYGVAYWPPSEVLSSAQFAAPGLSQLPVAAAPKSLPAQVQQSYSLDYYNRVHLVPLELNMGNLVTAQTRTVYVWNAWLNRTVTLAEIDAQNAEGIQLSNSVELPIDFLPLKERSWLVEVTPDGPPVIDASFMWVFEDDDGSPVLHITGNRLTAWMVPPDWANNVTETLSWLTDVQQAYDGNQTRLVCREAPRRQWEFTAIAYERERQILEAALYDWTARRWALPVWTDVTWLTSALQAGLDIVPIDTVNLDFRVGGIAVLWSSAWRYELVEISDVATGALVLKNPTTKAWAKGDRIYPCRTAMLTEAPSLPRLSDRLIKAQVRFLAAEPCDWPAVAPMTSYLGYPVLETRTDEPEDMAATHGRQMTLIDNDIGIPLINDPTGLPWPTQAFYWLLSGRQTRAKHRSLLYWLQGRANALWLPTWMDDIELTIEVTSISTTLSIVWIGYARFLHQRPGRRHLRIELKDGTVWYRRVTGSVEVDDENETLSIDTALGRSIKPSQVRQISWMMLATLNTDNVDIGHVHDSMGTATSSATFVHVPKEEP